VRPRRSSLAALVALVGICGCGGTSHSNPARSAASPRPAPRGPALGLTEDDADLLWNPSAAGTGGEAFQAARLRLTALHPTYVRLLIDWAALQPRPGRAPALEAAVSGCARDVGPCGPYAGIRDELAAIASQQRAAGSGDQRGFQVVIDILGTPAWAAHAPFGCELAGTAAFSRPLRVGAIAGYRALIRSLLALAASEGVSLDWWSPWNEPNDPRFISPQHSSCAPGAPSVSPGVYAQLARAMAVELRAAGGGHHLILGELNDLQLQSPHTTSISSFVAALPADVICSAGVWSIHAYAARHGTTTPVDAVSALEQALDGRGGCARHARIWVTEAGAGAPHTGRPRPAGAVDERDQCAALAEQLVNWYGDPRVDAVLQYTFREDPAFPVGLISADLSHVYPTYRLWLSYTNARDAGMPPPSPAAACA